MSVIETAVIKMHDPNVPLPFELFENENEYQFGKFEIRMKPDAPIINKPIYILFNIDVSGSMADKCIDKRTKMDHIKFTLENMLRLFHKYKDINISIYVQTFDTVVKQIIDTTNIHDTEIDQIVGLLKNVYPENLTNIESALQTAQEKIEAYNVESDSEIIHIFLTDGEITKGSHDDNYLYSLVSRKCKNVFIGYGMDHNSTLLNVLSKNKGDQYRFIDALEKAGLVYGEIIHEILYKVLEDVIISTDEGTEMYNYLTNTWVKRLEIGDLSSEQTKTIHIRTKNEKKPDIFLSGKTSDDNILVSDTEGKEVFVTDLSVYVFRQRTQELLYEARKATENYNPLKYDCPIPIYNRGPRQDPNNAEIEAVKDKLKSFHKIITDYIRTNNISNSILDMCCDDIYIAYKTLGTHVGNMFACARQTSNGREQTYICSEIPEEIFGQNNYNTPYDFLIMDDSEPEKTRQIGKDGDGDIDSYNLTQTYLSPYATDGVLNVMKEISM